MIGLWADKLYFTALDSLTSFRIDEVLVGLPTRPAFKHTIGDAPVVMSLWVGAGISPLFCGGCCVDPMHCSVPNTDKCKNG